MAEAVQNRRPLHRTRTPRVAVVGAGLSGIAMGVQLLQAGIESFTIYEKSDKIGGTWHANTYPGVACDVPSHFYQYEFAPNPSWSMWFASGAEIDEYLEKVANDYGVRPHIRCHTAVIDAQFTGASWAVTLSDGNRDEVDFLISATGILRDPKYPDIPGLDQFKGATLHSARWDPSISIAEKRVGIIGTGSTATQIISSVAAEVEQLTIFQRTPQWILPVPNGHVPWAVRQALRVQPLNRAAYLLTRAAVGIFQHAVVQPGWQRSVIGKVCRLNLATVKKRSASGTTDTRL
ncbi:cation diffusion facilitator CzcD-associated flavoprotein CzcO [Mycobacteroides chelonae]|nr:cation diffusion facilitator CzcD-associated flavoprotein CzcO [Mycobacteroides chelonae]